MNIYVDFGPYKLDFTASGRHMLAGGRKGHLALVDMMNMNLIKEIHVSFFFSFRIALCKLMI